MSMIVSISQSKALMAHPGPERAGDGSGSMPSPQAAPRRYLRREPRLTADGAITIDAPQRLMIATHGAVAQLGERRVRNAKVRGSIPLGSTIPHPECETFQCRACRLAKRRYQ